MYNLAFIQVTDATPDICTQFQQIMTQYILEINEHDENPLPEKFIPKAIKSLISLQGPQDRRQGYAKSMFLHLEKLFSKHGAKRMWLTADPVTGKPFWEAVGFINTGTKSPENNYDIYEKEISSMQNPKD